MECKFVVGQKVVCVLGFESERWINTSPNRPIVGNVYTIREIKIETFDNTFFGGFVELPGLFFQEIQNPPRFFSRLGETKEYAFPYNCFDSLNQRTTNIEVFTKILRPNRQKIKKPEHV